MRYILDSEGYVEAVIFGGMITCNNNSCTEYTGSIPSGYTSLEEWNDNANIRAYKIVDGNLVYDSNRDAELQALWQEQEAKNQSMTKLYSASSFVEVGTLSESANNFYGILLVAKEPSNNIKTSMFYPTEVALNTNLVIKTFDFTQPDALVGCRVIIGNDGKSLTMFTYDDSFIEAIYGVI